MLCTHCNKNEVNFHYEKINNGHYTEIHLCSDCAHKLGYLEYFPLSINSILSQFWGNELNTVKMASSCSVCDDNYDIFEDVAKSMMPITKKKDNTTEDISSLKVQLEKAIKEENYEQAAIIRDKIRALEKNT